MRHGGEVPPALSGIFEKYGREFPAVAMRIFHSGISTRILQDVRRTIDPRNSPSPRVD